MRFHRFVRDDKGALVVEFALVVPILMLIVFGIIDFSRAYYTLGNLDTAVREGARYAALLRDPGGVQEQDVKDLVRKRFVGFGSDSLVDSQINVDLSNPVVTVTVANYPFRLLTPLASVFGASTINLDRSAVFRWELAPP
ncbi:MAG: TadE/TadG family type IV pilus assembly protein [Gemmatimonadaceae bacterium]